MKKNGEFADSGIVALFGKCDVQTLASSAAAGKTSR